MACQVIGRTKKSNLKGKKMGNRTLRSWSSLNERGEPEQFIEVSALKWINNEKIDK